MTNEVGSWIPRTRANAHDKFPPDYRFELDEAESRSLRTKISTLKPEGANRDAHSKYNYKAFTEKGLYIRPHSVGARTLKGCFRRLCPSRQVDRSTSRRGPRRSNVQRVFVAQMLHSHTPGLW